MKNGVSVGDSHIGPFTGQVNTARVCDASMAWLSSIASRLEDPCVLELTSGRNRNVRLTMPLLGNETSCVVVKAFGGRYHCGTFVNTLMKGSKARRTWVASCHLHGHGVATPEPIAFLERTVRGCVVESYYISRYQENSVSFADALNHLYRHVPDCEKLMDLLQTVADAIRTMHESGFLHNDLGNQNILLQTSDEDAVWQNPCFIDLNRGRIKPSLSDRDRGRDLSRIALPSDFLRVFKEMYWGGTIVPPLSFQRWEQHYRWRFALHSRTRSWRHPIREARRARELEGRTTYPAPKDVWVWDERSAQPLVTMLSKDRSRFYPWSRGWHAFYSTLKALPSVAVRAQQLRREAFSKRVPLSGTVGVGIDCPKKEHIVRKLALIESLGTIPIFVRFYHHRGLQEAERTAGFVETLLERGHPVSIALIQDRAAVLDGDSWRQFVNAILERLASKVELVEAGHAINRVKWGIWDFKEYRHLMDPFAEWKRRYPKVSFGGPAMIDFEYIYIPPALDALPAGFSFDALTHHLYVDRRGAPETPQGRFSALEKFALARALADRCGDRLIVSEFNWPLEGTGVFSPVGAPYVSPGIRKGDPSVSETMAAAYLLRYVLMAIGSGLVERVFWWRLAAYGYGLVDDSDDRHWRERPACKALRFLLERFRSASFVSREEVQAVTPEGSSGVVYGFEDASGRPWWMAYTVHDACRIPSPCPQATVMNAYGECQAPSKEHDDSIELHGMPIYLLP